VTKESSTWLKLVSLDLLQYRSLAWNDALYNGESPILKNSEQCNCKHGFCTWLLYYFTVACFNLFPRATNPSHITGFICLSQFRPPLPQQQRSRVRSMLVVVWKCTACLPERGPYVKCMPQCSHKKQEQVHCLHCLDTARTRALTAFDTT